MRHDLCSGEFVLCSDKVVSASLRRVADVKQILASVTCSDAPSTAPNNNHQASNSHRRKESRHATHPENTRSSPECGNLRWEIIISNNKRRILHGNDFNVDVLIIWIFTRAFASVNNVMV